MNLSQSYRALHSEIKECGTAASIMPDLPGNLHYINNIGLFTSSQNWTTPYPNQKKSR